MKVLVVASAKAELKAFGDEYIKLVTGIGPVLAAAATASAIERYSPDVVVSVGTAGSVGKLSVGEIVSFGSVIFPDLDLTSYGLAKGETLLSGGKRLGAIPLDPDSSYVLSTSSSFASVPNAYSDASDMEGYGVALAAYLRNIPVFAVKAITDIIGNRVGLAEYTSIRKGVIPLLPQRVESVLCNLTLSK